MIYSKFNPKLTLLRFVTSKDPILTRFLNQLLLKEKPAPVGFLDSNYT